MRISHSNKFVFLALPRSGSTTVRSLLDESSDICSVHITERTDTFPFYHHISAPEVREIFVQKGWAWSDYVKFCFVRNPFDRVVSLYHHAIKMRKRKKMEEGIITPATPLIFRKYVASLDTKSRLMTSLEHFIRDGGGKDLVDHVLPYESLDTALPAFLASLGIEIAAGDIPRLNVSEGRNDYRQYYDQYCRDRVADLYRYEIERFGYSF